MDESETLMKTLDARKKMLKETLVQLEELDINGTATEGRDGVQEIWWIVQEDDAAIQEG
jgi:hypothetical protein